MMITAPYKECAVTYNIGKSKPIQLLDFIETLEKEVGLAAIRKYLPKQDSDVEKTWASTERLKANYGYKPNTLVEKGVAAFVAGYLEYYNYK